jgi:FixJ family two-component response regulator
MSRCQPLQRPGMTNRRIIGVIDDDCSVLKGVSRLLTALGYGVRSYASAADFLQRPRAEDALIGCLVVDVHMPGMSGIELRGQLALTSRSIPTIFITGVADEGLRRRVVGDGVIGVLEKPFDATALLRAVTEALAMTVPAASGSLPPEGVR